MQKPNTILIAYIPVLHRGYMQLVAQFTDSPVFLLDEKLIAEFDHLRKDIRSLKPAEVQKALQALGFSQVTLLTSEQLQKLAEVKSGAEPQTICMSDEDIMHELAERYLPTAMVQYEKVSLRWDSKKTLEPQPVNPDEIVSTDEKDLQLMAQAQDQAAKSMDWWRQVGAVLLTKDGEVMTGHNHHLPTEQEPYYAGDPRGNFHKKEYIEFTTAQHTEATLIAQAARTGQALEGSKLYVTTFPCPVCAKLVSESGISTVYYMDGYSMVDGERMMKEAGIQIIRVEKPKA